MYDTTTGKPKQVARLHAINHITSKKDQNAEYVMFPSENANCIEAGCVNLNFPSNARFHCIESNRDVIVKSKQAISKLRLKRWKPINPCFYLSKFEELDFTEIEKNLRGKLGGAFNDFCGQITHSNQNKVSESKYLYEKDAPVAFTYSLVNRNSKLLSDMERENDYSGHQIPEYELNPEYLDELFSKGDKSFKANYFNTLEALKQAGYNIKNTFVYRDIITDENGLIIKAKKTAMLLVLATVK